MHDFVDIKTRQAGSFHADVVAGLAARRKTFPSRWLYDDLGCELFEQITHLDEYYPTRTETAILRQNSVQIADFCGSRAALIEYGAGEQKAMGGRLVQGKVVARAGERHGRAFREACMNRL